MKRMFSVLLVVLVALASAAGIARADEAKMVGVVDKIELAADGTSADVTLIENGSGDAVKVLVADDLTLDKFKDHRIVEGDEVRVKYEEKDGKKLSTYFRKTAGC